LLIDGDISGPLDFSRQAHAYYAKLLERAHAADPDLSLGGQLLWAAELNADGRALVVAGNIAGAATLTATHDPAAQRQAVRDGIVDFLVTSLDEALRILKNQIRRRETVAVCVGLPVEAVERDMAARGVLPDVRRDEVIDSPGPETESKTLVIWRVSASPARWLPKLDAVALDCFEPQDKVGGRWLRFAGRYLGRIGLGARMAWSTPDFAARFLELVRKETERGEINVAVQIEIESNGSREAHLVGPKKSA
jgi:urocanate hydratase